MSEEAQGTRAHWARASCIATIILPNEPHAQPHNWVLFSGELRSPVLGKMVCCSCEAQACMGNYSATQESRESVLCDLAPRVAVTRIKTAWVAGHVPQIAMVHSTELGTQIIYFIHLSGPAVLSKRGSECAHRKMAGFHLIPLRGKVCENQYFVDFQLIFLCIFQKSHGINQSCGRVPSMFSFVFSPKVIPDILVTSLMVLSKHLFHFFSPYFKSYLLC